MIILDMSSIKLKAKSPVDIGWGFANVLRTLATETSVGEVIGSLEELPNM